MKLSNLDRDSRATKLSAEAQAALARGDTVRAKQLHTQAGEILEKNSEGIHQASEKNLALFLAASQYYHGGEYQRASKLCGKIQPKLLRGNDKELYQQFLKDVKQRSSPDYEQTIRNQIHRLIKEEKYKIAIETLSHHPYVYSPDNLAPLRAILCESLKDYRAAAIFFSNAIRFDPENLKLVLMTIGLPLSLPDEDQIKEVWEYMGHQLKLIPHPITYISASLVCFHRASLETGQERQRITEEQLTYFKKAKDSFFELPLNQQEHLDFRAYMEYCFNLAAFGMIRIGHDEEAKEICQEAIAFGSHFPHPYFYLARHTLAKGDFQETLSLCKKALTKQPPLDMESDVYGLMAISQANLEANSDEVEALFQKALQIDPKNMWISINHQRFKEQLVSAQPHNLNGWIANEKPVFDETVIIPNSELSEKFNQKESIKQTVQTADRS
jgi:tetratricopeptide (TPR) repeat protein